MSSFKPSCASTAKKPQELSLLDGGDFCRSSSSGLMRPFGSSHAHAVPAQIKSKSEVSLLTSLPKGTRPGWLIRYAHFWHQDVHSTRVTKPVSDVEFPRTLPCGQSRTGKLPLLTSSSVTQCFCAGLVKTSKKPVEFSYLQIGLGPFTDFGHV